MRLLFIKKYAAFYSFFFAVVPNPVYLESVFDKSTEDNFPELSDLYAFDQLTKRRPTISTFSYKNALTCAFLLVADAAFQQKPNLVVI